MKSFAASVLLLAVVISMEMPVFAQSFPPTVTYSSLLSNLKMLNETGEITMQSMWALFLPVTGDLDPSSRDQLRTEICKPDGAVLATYNWFVSKSDPPFWEMAYNQCNADGQIRFFLKEEGNYILKFFVNQTLFYEFPFSVVTFKNTDPYNSSITYYLEGSWKDYAYLYADPGEPDEPLVFKVFLHCMRDIDGYNYEYSPKIKLFRDGDLIGFNNEPGYRNLKVQKFYERFDLQLYHPEADGGDPFYIKELYAKDGNYSIQFYLDDQLYGRYDFKVSGGKIPYQDRQIRDGGSYYPLQYIEGTTAAFWMKRIAS